MRLSRIAAAGTVLAVIAFGEIGFRGPGLYEMMNKKSSRVAVLDVVAVLADLPAVGLGRGQVGTVVETADNDNVLVEFSDNDGRAYAIVPCAISDLLVLHYLPEAAA